MSWWEDLLIAAAAFEDAEERASKHSKSKQNQKNTPKSKTKTKPKTDQAKKRK